MQFGVFSVGDVTTDPTTGRTPSEAERIEAMVTIALKAEEIGLDVFATGEHHNPPFVPSSPTTLLGYIAAKTERLILSTATTLITTNDPVKIAEDFAMLQHLAGGRVDLMLGRGNTGPVYPWFGQDIRNGIALAVENYALLHRLWREDVVDWQGSFRTPLTGFTTHAAAARRHPAVRVARLDPVSPEIAEQAAYYGDGFFHNNIFWPKEHVQRMVELYRRRFEHYGHGRAPDQAIVGLGGQVFMRHDSQAAIREFRPYFDHAPVYGGGPSLEDYMDQTPLTVGSPQQVIDRTLGVPRHRRRLPAPAVPPRSRRTAVEDGPGAAGHAGRGGRAGAAARVREAPACRRAGRTDACAASSRARRGAPRRGDERADRTTRRSTGRPIDRRTRGDRRIRRRDDDHAHDRRRDRGPQPAVIDPPAGRSAGRRHAPRARRRRLRGPERGHRAPRARDRPRRTTC